MTAREDEPVISDEEPVISDEEPVISDDGAEELSPELDETSSTEELLSTLEAPVDVAAEEEPIMLREEESLELDARELLAREDAARALDEDEPLEVPASGVSHASSSSQGLACVHELESQPTTRIRTGMRIHAA